jgi:hypothetical protein
MVDKTDPSNRHYLKNLLTSIFTLADATKLQEKIRLSKEFKWSDYKKSFKIDSTQSAPLKSFLSLNFSCNFVASASAKIDVNKFNKIY